MNTNQKEKKDFDISATSMGSSEQEFNPWMVTLLGFLLIFLSSLESKAQTIEFNNGVPSGMLG